MYIEISNSGEIEVESFKLLGASTKRDEDGKIGFFGSGIKYSIAYLLRNNLSFKVFSGENEVVFSIQPTTFRDKSFDKILVNGTETSLTTSWGPNWTKWQIFREIISNALDEGGFNLAKTDGISGEAGKTKIFLKYSDFEGYYKNISNFFLLGDKNVAGIIQKDEPSDLIVYKMGVRVVQEVTEDQSTKLPASAFNYNIPSISLNEERVADRWQIEYLSSRLLMSLTDKSTITRLYNLLTSESNCSLFEYKVLEGSIYAEPSKEWLEVIESSPYTLAPKSSMVGLTENRGEKFIRKHNVRSIPDSLYNRLKEVFLEQFTKNIDKISGISGEYVELEITRNQKKLINQALEKISEAGIDIRYPIKVVSFFKEGSIMGMAKDETIFLSDKVFDVGVLYVISTIIEEYIHLKHAVRDETRQFQDVALNLLASVIFNNIVEEQPSGV